ncbi:MAG TPA: RHS repeat domain-containing protein, partial [Acidimicrobiales bacterium]|nr:RHS repeat domain-containing protein [Acidimicrobiales bacterium]
LAADESFVAGVARALAGADGWDGSVATVSDAAVAAELASLGGVASTGVLEVPASALLGDAPTSGFADDPVCTATGNFAHSEVDLTFPGRAAPLALTRWYNSMSERTGAFGPGWSSLLDARLIVGEDSVVALLPDGAEIRFQRDGSAAWRGDARPRLRLRAVPSPDRGAGVGSFELVDGPASGYGFDASGAVTRRWVGRSEVVVTREDGVVVALAERCSGRSVALSWEAGRVAGARSSDGREVAYGYDGPHLVAVSRPSGAMRYEVAAGKVVGIVDADGVALVANRYDESGRVVAQTSPFGRVSRYSYGPGGMTVVAGDEGIRNAFVHDTGGNLVAIVDGSGRPM